MSFIRFASMVRQSTAARVAVFAGVASVVALAPAVTVAQDRGGNPSDHGYAIGYDLGREIASQLDTDGVRIDRAALVKGFDDAVNGRNATMNSEDMERVLTELHRRVAEREAQERYQNDPVFRALADRNKATGDSFREAFARRDGAQTLPSGVIYSIVRDGTGEQVGDAKMVVANFVAMTPDGHEFSRGRGQEFAVSTLLPGARDFVGRMRVGERAYVAIPPERAMGLAGRDGDIGPNETVVLDVEIVDVKR